LLGPNCVRLIEERRDGLLLEEVVPGTPLSAVDDDVATMVLAEVMAALWTPVPRGCRLPTVAAECDLLGLGLDLGLPSELVEAARVALAELLADPLPARVLHGDLHHDNVLSGPEGWVAIDPHGVVGDPGYDVGPLLLNPWGWLASQDVATVTHRRLGLLASVLGQPVGRLAKWGLVRAVLSECWCVQDTGDVDGGPLRVAEVLVHLV
jgi:streptomycin 6-kinase